MDKKIKKKKFKKIELENMNLEDIREQNLDVLQNNSRLNLQINSSSCSQPGSPTGGGGA